jgi:hypothetical protein
MSRHLVILSCSATKIEDPAPVPAILRYDGPAYKVLRSFLRGSSWPGKLSVGVLSAEFGLIGGLAPIPHYDRRMDARRALDLRSKVTETLIEWGESHRNATFILGKDYLPAVNLDALSLRFEVAAGSIGFKLQRLSNLLADMRSAAIRPPIVSRERPLYFLPDWDDVLDVDFDFKRDAFSQLSRADRNQRHCVQLMLPARICDGVLVSLAQNQGAKGVLRRSMPTDVESLAPPNLRTHFGLANDQWVFGDCGAFTYANEPEPTITTEQALTLYDIYGFDLGASVDHIPLPFVTTEKGRRDLTLREQRRRVKITRDNAALFIALHRRRRCQFVPVGIIQGLTPAGFARQVPAYAEMGYEYVALGGLVPRSDADIVSIVEAVGRARSAMGNAGERLRVHLFGVFRPKIQPLLRKAGILSFDSATYFRKAWLRSNQNYLASDGQWYAAIRVPVLSDYRAKAQLQRSGIRESDVVELERNALSALHEFDRGARSLDSALAAVHRYDSLFQRSSEIEDLRAQYRQALKAQPWKRCNCAVCTALGIDVLIFRGSNRNKRRGAHNTLQLYRLLNGDHGSPVG